MASEIDICNMALSQLHANIIQSMDEASREARMCKLHYPTVRDGVLRAHKWGFATKTAPLALLADGYEGWDYAYAYPVDCLAARTICDAAKPYGMSQVRFEIRTDADMKSRVICTNQADAVLEYTARVEAAGLYDAKFVNALVAALAAALAIPIKQSPRMQQTQTQLYQISLADASAASANEGLDDPDPLSDFEKARWS